MLLDVESRSWSFKNAWQEFQKGLLNAGLERPEELLQGRPHHRKSLDSQLTSLFAQKVLSPEKWNAGCLCPSCSVHIPTGSKYMWFSLQGSGIGEPSLYHALVVIFLEFFAWGLLTTPMITVSFSSSCFPFYRILYTQCLFVYFFRYWMKHFLITLSWWMDWLLASR